MGHPVGAGTGLRWILGSDSSLGARFVARACRQHRQLPPQIATLFGISPTLGRVSFPAPAAAASIYLSAICAASLKILTNIGRVSFPVWVFWFEGWYEASNVFPSGSLYVAPC